MMRVLWGLKAGITGEDRSVFSHDQMEIAHNVVIILDAFIHALEALKSGTPTKYDLEPVRIYSDRARYIQNSIKNMINVSEEILSKRGPDLAKRPYKFFTKVEKEVSHVPMDRYAIDPRIKKTLKDVLDALNKQNTFNKLYGVDVSLDMFLPAFKKELELGIK